jgi:RNA-binding protein
MRELNSRQRRFLSAKAAQLSPVVMLGKEGAAPGLIEALKAALEDHELVKLKFVGHKEERRSIASELAQAVDAALVRVIGNVAVYYRPSEEPESRRFTLPD